MQKVITKEIDLSGRTLKLETGKLAQQADASVVATWGETVVLATVATKPIKEDPGYFPLSVEYVEKHYASGRITPQKFIKREGRPSEKSILAGRAIDRAIRPLFPKEFRNEVQVMVTVLSYDGVNDPATLGFSAASAALAISSVPWAGPLAGVRVGELDGQLVANPALADIEKVTLQVLVAASTDLIAMVEAEAKQAKDERVFEAIKLAHKEAQPVIKMIQELVKEVGKEKQSFTSLTEGVDAELLKTVKKDIYTKVSKALSDTENIWHDSTGDLIKAEITETYGEKLTEIQISFIFDKVAKQIMSETILAGKRVDGRGLEQIRDIEMELGLLPRAHGSALFQRGASQSLSIATLGPLSDSQTLEGMEGESQKRFMHYYNMSINPFSSGDVKRIGSPNRRDIGHGNLGEISLKGVLPSEVEFPYAIRVVSEILGANASTSQAAICAASLAMWNAGVPMEPVAGIALGLITEHSEDDNGKPGRFQVITDMQATEDFYGEMDFKVAGTVNGITGIQMDTKLHGLTFEIVEEALRQGKAAREQILAKMSEMMPTAAALSPYAPKISAINIDPENIGKLIGSGGKTINAIIARTGAQIDIEDDGRVMISAVDQAAVDRAVNEVEGMFKEVTVGETYTGKVVRIVDFGAFVEIMPGRDGLVHVSQMAPERVEHPSDVVSEGQEVKVRVTEVDPMGKIGLSMLFGADIKQDSERRPSGGGRGGDRGGNRGGFGGGDRGGSRGGFGGDRGGSRGGFGGDRGGSRGGFGGDRGGNRGGFGGDRGGNRGGFGGGDRGGSRGGFGGDRGGSRGGRTGGFSGPRGESNRGQNNRDFDR